MGRQLESGASLGARDQGTGVQAKGDRADEMGKCPIGGGGPEGGRGRGEGAREAEKGPSSSSSSSDYLEHQVHIFCDVCGDLNPASDICFDAVGCTHMFCFGCLSLHAAVEDSGVDVVPCPVSGCRAGFLEQIHNGSPLPPPPVAAEEEEQTAADEVSTCFCSICMERKPPEECFLDLRGCDHVFCAECVAGYVAAKVGENSVVIRCPEPGCGSGRLEPEACRSVIPAAVFDRWGAALCEAAIGEGARFFCPYRDCSALLWMGADEGGQPMMDAQCLHCGRVCCAQCRVPWHDGLSCQEYRRKAAEREETKQVMEMVKKKQWQRCPKCGFVVERVDGCVFIRCRCNHCFCYRCASPMDLKDPKHYCNKCHLTWDDKQG